MTSLSTDTKRSQSRKILNRHAAVGTVALAFALLAQDWIAGVAVLVLYAVWQYLLVDEGPPVLAIALTMQWLQINSAIVYEAFTGRRVATMTDTDYRPMVLIGLGCLVALIVGLKIGMISLRKRVRGPTEREGNAFPLARCVIVYIAMIPAIGVLQSVAWIAPGLNQPILALSMLRYVVLFLVFRMLVYPEFRVGWFVLILAGEIGIGITGFFAGFREPIFFAVLALLERSSVMRSRRILFSLATIAGLLLFLSLVWTGIKTEYRAQYESHAESVFDRVESVAELSYQWFDSSSEEVFRNFDKLVERMWPMYYPALAVNNALDLNYPPLGGEILGGAIAHVLMPRFLFPEKLALRSDSDSVREFSGVMVAGDESDTSIAFGYAPELFLDLGVPLMFIPVLIFGWFIGFTYRWLLNTIRHRDLAIAVTTVICWLTLYLFERSLVRTVGLAGTFIFYVGGVGILIDRYISTLPRASDLNRPH